MAEVRDLRSALEAQAEQIAALTSEKEELRGDLEEVRYILNRPMTEPVLQQHYRWFAQAVGILSQHGHHSLVAGIVSAEAAIQALWREKREADARADRLAAALRTLIEEMERGESHLREGWGDVASQSTRVLSVVAKKLRNALADSEQPRYATDEEAKAAGEKVMQERRALLERLAGKD